MKERGLTRKQVKTLKIISLVICVVVLLLFTAAIGIPMVRYAERPEQFRAFVERRELLGSAVYIFMVFLQVIIALIPGEPIEILGGYAFGTVKGTLLCLIGAAFGSVVVFLLVKRFGRRLAQVFFSEEKLDSLRFLKHSKKRDFIFFIIFMLPGTPKDLLSYFVGMTDIPFGLWLIICSLGRLPSVITSTVGGDALGTKSYFLAVVFFAIALCVSVVGFIVYGFILKKKEK